jgi:hypothetical protein
MNAEDLGEVDNGKNPQHLVLRRGQQQVTPPRILAQLTTLHGRQLVSL